MYENDKNVGKKLKFDEGKRGQWKNVHYEVLWSVHALYVCHSFDCTTQLHHNITVTFLDSEFT